jgi:hypothetical protein
VIEGLNRRKFAIKLGSKFSCQNVQTPRTGGKPALSIFSDPESKKGLDFGNTDVAGFAVPVEAFLITNSTESYALFGGRI